MDDQGSRSAATYFPGEGEMVRAVHAKDWSATPIGPVAHWPACIRSAVGICLNSDFQISVLVGRELVYVYNDATAPIFGDKHPEALGRRVADVWSEAWASLGPVLMSVLDTSRAVRMDDWQLILQRRGFSEECYFSVSYSPILDDDGRAAGVFVATMETSRRFISERRLRTLNHLATQVALRRGDEQTLELVRAALADNPFDVPLCALYLAVPGADCAEQVFCAGLHEGCAGIDKRIPWSGDGAGAHPLSPLARSFEPQTYDAAALLAPADTCGAWPEPPREIIALPFTVPGYATPHGFLLFAANPRAPLDQEYRHFIDTIAGLVGTAVAGIEAIAAERRRSEATAELDRSKSTFFANASHELRTPVTLILGPLSELLENTDAALAPGVREFIELAHRNAQRLHKLVNTIMDFASIEAGRLPMRPEPVDVGALTAEVASLFRSAIEGAGLRLDIRNRLPAGEALVDRDMWETVVSNLLSNAYKFTPSGEIAVELEAAAGMLRLTVRDTGVGIAHDELERVFERFYRGGSSAGRKHVEGSGIGLALVRELVRLSGGGIDVASVPGRGSAFTVTLPWRVADAAAPRATPPARALRLPEPVDARPAQPDAFGPPAGDKPVRVVVVDDNADIVHYIERLLKDTCSVESARDAASGLAAVRATNPELVLVDVMMPGVDGLDLVRAIRADPAIRTVSVIVLSARAGADARLDALAAGADEYMAKPFSGRELVARVASHVRMARIRRAAFEQEAALKREIAEVRHDLASVLEATSDTFIGIDADLRVLALNEAAATDLGAPKQELMGRTLLEIAPFLAGSALEQAMRAALAGKHPAPVEYFLRPSNRWINVRCYPAPHGALVLANDITEVKSAEQMLIGAKMDLERRVELRTEQLRQANRLLAAVFDRAPGGIAITDTNGVYVRANPAYQSLVGYSEPELAGRSLADVTVDEDFPPTAARLRALLDGVVASTQIESRTRRADGAVIWVHNFMSMIEDEDRRPRYFVVIAKDITERKRVEAERRAAQEELNVLYERLQTVREAERTALAREVHDQLGQTLSAAKIDLKLLERDIGANGAALAPDQVIPELHSACATLDRAMQLVRDIATELRAPELDGQGLYAAIGWHARDFERRTRLPTHVELPAGLAQPSRPAAEALLRIFQEATTNVLRHAHASQVWVSVERRGGALLLRVRDDGAGIARQHARAVRSLGITGMQERAALVRGRLRVGPLQPRGTLVSALIPMDAQHKEKGGRP
ncbi:PAS domain-containing protein [Massilia sp. R2A-15]|uniref:PAS domain-containing protein n=1 Tax=Massilia sp. R2A-15 TaxID=3064278 RepID=UPI0027374794|nr:PAS domain-containing protein [Massilia sp. R2A-15]WLI91369.1 PAS domain-containing protein [Massilia sp. R2A-15]